ncbi:MAG: polyphosphate glucokinase [Acidimicrobiaceae bacterium]
MSDQALFMGIDIGGSGIKGAPVDIQTGQLTAERLRIVTPQPARPGPVADVVAQVVEHHGWNGPVGVTFPAVIKNGVALTAANVDKSWIGTDADEVFTKRLGMPVFVMNDADAAGLAEMRFGAGRDRDGVVVMITLGTGIGCAVFLNGQLVPNTELGHIELGGKDAETIAAASVRDRKGLTWKKYAERVQAYLRALDALIWPDLVIIGGGVSKTPDKFLPLIDVRPEVVPAALQNEAGIVGAALAASQGTP